MAEALRAPTPCGTLREELGLEPSPALRELEARVLTDDPTLLRATPVARRRPVRAPATGRDAPSSSGADDDRRSVSPRVRRDRLVTLTGPGGVGKTRLALRLAGDLWDELDGEVFVVELAPVHDPARRSRRSRPRSTCSSASTCRSRRRSSSTSAADGAARARQLRAPPRDVAPLVDGCSACAPTSPSWPRAARCSVSPASRSGGSGRSALVPTSMPTVATHRRSARGSAAVRRAGDRGADPGFALGPTTPTPIAEIVRRLDGLPLAHRARGGAHPRDEPRGARRAPRPTLRPARRRADVDDRPAPDAARSRGVVARPARAGRAAAVRPPLRVRRQLRPRRGGGGLRRRRPRRRRELDAAREPRRQVDGAARRRGPSPATGSSRHCASSAATGSSRRANAPPCALATRIGISPWPSGRPRALGGPDEADAVATLDRDFDNLRAAHLWSLEHGDTDVALRLVAALREYAFRRMRAEITGWAERQSAPRCRAARALPGRDRGRARTGGSCAATSRARSNSASAPSPPPSARRSTPRAWPSARSATRGSTGATRSRPAHGWTA